MMSDTLGSYGSLARFKDLDRIRAVNNACLIGGGGDYSDFQFICDNLEDLVINDHELADGAVLTANEIHSYLSRMLYGRRSKMNPLWNQLVVGGVDNGKSFLGMVDLHGSAFEDDIMTTGYGTHLALPLLRKQWRADLTHAEAKKLLESCMNVLFYRDCRTINKVSRKSSPEPPTSLPLHFCFIDHIQLIHSFLVQYRLATITKDGPTVSEPYSLQTEWGYKLFVNPSA